MIGVALIEEAVRNDCEIYAIVRENSQRIKRLTKSDKVHIIECDLKHLKEVSIPTDKCDVLYHFAWNHTDGDGRNNPVLQAENIIYTIAAVELAHKTGCTRFVGAGSQAEYGIVEGVISPETIANPVMPYGVSKYAAGKLSEKLCVKYGIEFVWGRIFSVYGKYDNESTMINTSIDKFIDGKVASFSSATQMWNYLNERDAGRIFFLLGTKKEVAGIYCVASPISRVLKDYICEMAEEFGSEVKLEFDKENPNLKPVTLNPDVSKLVRDIGFAEKVSFRDGIKEVISFRKARKV